MPRDVGGVRVVAFVGILKYMNRTNDIVYCNEREKYLIYLHLNSYKFEESQFQISFKHENSLIIPSQSVQIFRVNAVTLSVLS